jgi:peptidoglycan/xylan/chitin deacetylase (PgdA/CDA1 family)
MVKRAILHLCKWLGLFQAAFLITKGHLRILCYHGFALHDEVNFRPKLFMRPETFLKRMSFLANKGFPVVPFATALRGIGEGSLPSGAIVLTIDDGWTGVYDRAVPILRQFSFPATIYVVSYYAAKGTPVFRLAIQYLFWKTRQVELFTRGLGLPLPEVLSIASGEDRERIVSTIIEFGETNLDEASRCSLSRMLGERLRVPYEDLVSTRIFSLMNPSEIREALDAGMDIQLHTHRHRLPLDRELVRLEIKDNRDFLEPLVGKELKHFCYPSGIWSKEQWPWLAELGIESATTCLSGLNSSATPRLGLMRFLDGENISAIEFEAEIYGLSELLRIGRAFLKGVIRGRAKAVETSDGYSSD